jgi:predicted lipid-binding transport protein (Tim44 family)
VLTGTVVERGTDRPTVFDPRRQAEWEALLADDPEASEEGIAHRAALIFRELNEAWARRDLRPARPFVSDGLMSYLGYWVQAYRSAGLTNRVEDARLTGRALARVQRDRWYDAVTLRLWAEGKEQTTRDADGALVGGSRTATRRWSEYWTLIRRRGTRGAARVDAACPRCGGPLDDIAMSGECVHCGAHVTGGEFDWVLGRIEQDESYVG